MPKASRSFQIFAKPVGATCNLDCHYCYYLNKKNLYPEDKSLRMSDKLLEEYIVQHINASPDPVIRFSWHGGEPTILGLDTFQKIVKLQRKHKPKNQRIANGIQTNGILLDEKWCRFLAEESFEVGLSIDGPKEIHDQYRVTKDGKSSFEKTMHGYELLRKHNVTCNILCVVNAYNVQYPKEVYTFFKKIKSPYINFLPLVQSHDVNLRVPAEDCGTFLCTIFDEWLNKDIGQIKVHIFEEAARTAFEQEHSLCIFRPTCGDVPVIEHNGDFYCCDHFVDEEHHLGNIQQTPLVELIENPKQKAFGKAKQDKLPNYCQKCEVLEMCNGGCPKYRVIKTPDGEEGLNYLCAGYKKFFNHCQPWVEEIKAQWQSQIPQQQMPQTQTNQKTGRNEPCPCGSGRKYKKCCLNK